jgi:protein SCO1/2
LSVGTTGGTVKKPSSTRRRGRLVWWIVLACVLAGALAIGPYLRWGARSTAPEYGVVIDSPAPAESFTLDSTTGAMVSLDDFRGKPVLLYFGYTTCPDVCPTTLSDLSTAMKLLGDRRNKVQVLFVTVDPGRDTVSRMATYLKFFDPAFIGLAGPVEKIEAIASRFGVIFVKRKAETAADYLVDHTSTVMAIDSEGYLRFMFPYGTTGEQMAADINKLIR